MDLFLKTKGLTHFIKVIWYAKSENQCFQAEKWRLIELICIIFKMDAKIIQNLTLLLIHCIMYMCLGIFVGVLCWSLFYYASICVLSIFVNTLTRKRMIVALL